MVPGPFSIFLSYLEWLGRFLAFFAQVQQEDQSGTHHPVEQRRLSCELVQATQNLTLKDDAPIWMALDSATPRDDHKLAKMLLYASSDSQANPRLKIEPLKIQMTSLELSALFNCIAQKGQHAMVAVQRLLAPYLSNAPFAWLDEYSINNFYSQLARENPALKIATLLAADFPNTIDAQADQQQFQILADKLTENGRRKHEYQQLKNANLIFWPVHDAQKKHWHLLIIERNLELPYTFTIRGLDGFNSVAEHEKFYPKAESLLRQIHSGVTLNIITGSYLVPRQNNSVDCGVVGPFYAQRLCEGQKLENYATFKDVPCDYKAGRIMMAQSISQQEDDVFYNYGRDPILQRFPTVTKKVAGNVQILSQLVSDESDSTDRHVCEKMTRR